MSIFTNWSVSDLKLDADAVLRGQGADPSVIRNRKPRLVEIADQALQSSRFLLEPKVILRKLTIRTLLHEKLEMEAGLSIKGAWISKQLAPAQRVYAIICTVGQKIETEASRNFETNMLMGLAMDGVGSAGVEALATLVCKQIEDQAESEGLQTTVPFSPGMLDWSVNEGQPVIFGLLSGINKLVELTPSYLMKPRKSLSMLLGVGKDLGVKGSTCEYCAMQGTCKYRVNGSHNEVATVPA